MNQEELLFTVLSDFARTLATGLPVQRILEHLVARVVDVRSLLGDVSVRPAG